MPTTYTIVKYRAEEMTDAVIAQLAAQDYVFLFENLGYIYWLRKA